MHWANQKIVHALFAYTLAFALGILARFFEINFYIILFAIILSVGLNLACFFKNLKINNIKFFLMIIIFFSAGFIRFYFWEKRNDKIIGCLKTESGYCAQVLDISNHSHPFFRYKILLKLKPENQKLNFNINIYSPKLFGIRVGDWLNLSALKINCPKNHQNLLYSNESLTPSLSVNKLDFSITYRPKFSFLRVIKESKKNLAENLSKKMSKATSTLFDFIFLGLKNKNYLSDKLRYKFNYWGIAHYLARSGLHVVLIIFLWSIFLKLIPIGFILKQLVLIALVLIYFALSWSSTSFERAIVIFFIVQACLILKLPIRSSYLLTLCTLIFLIINPKQLFFLDFQLSFGLALGISFFNEIQNKKS